MNVILKKWFLFGVMLIALGGHAQVKNEYAAIDAKVAEIPDSLTRSTAAIAKFINSNFNTDTEKIRAAFYWTASNIRYDVNNMYAVNFNETSQNKIDKALSTHKGICINYAEVLSDITNKIGIKSVIIEGYTKQNGTADYLAHAWCGAKVDNRWYLFDPTWGAGFLSKNKFVPKINNFYFKAMPDKMIMSHMPFDFLWEFLNDIVTNQQFYDGKVNPGKKPNFDFETEITNYENLSPIEQLRSSVARIEANGVKNALIFDRLSYKKQQIIYMDFNAIVLLYNGGVNELNDFINFRNKQFKPAVSDADLLEAIESPKAKLLKSQNLIENLKDAGPNTANVESMKKSIAQTLKQTEEQEIFVKDYLSKGKAGRKSMFYKVSVFGVLVN